MNPFKRRSATPAVDLSELFATAGLDWSDPNTWPPDFKLCYEVAAKVAITALRAQGKHMMDVKIVNKDDEPVTMLFAIGERAVQLRSVWDYVYASNNQNIGS